MHLDCSSWLHGYLNHVGICSVSIWCVVKWQWHLDPADLFKSACIPQQDAFCHAISSPGSRSAEATMIGGRVRVVVGGEDKG